MAQDSRSGIFRDVPSQEFLQRGPLRRGVDFQACTALRRTSLRPSRCRSSWRCGSRREPRPPHPRDRTSRTPSRSTTHAYPISDQPRSFRHASIVAAPVFRLAEARSAEQCRTMYFVDLRVAVSSSQQEMPPRQAGTAFPLFDFLSALDLRTRL